MWVIPGPGLTMSLYKETMPELKKLKKITGRSRRWPPASLGGRPEVTVEVKTLVTGENPSLLL